MSPTGVELFGCKLEIRANALNGNDGGTVIDEFLAGVISNTVLYTK